MLNYFFVASTAPAIEFGEIATLVVIERMEPKSIAVNGLRMKKAERGKYGEKSKRVPCCHHPISARRASRANTLIVPAVISWPA